MSIGKLLRSWMPAAKAPETTGVTGPVVPFALVDKAAEIMDIFIELCELPPGKDRKRFYTKQAVHAPGDTVFPGMTCTLTCVSMGEREREVEAYKTGDFDRGLQRALSGDRLIIELSHDAAGVKYDLSAKAAGEEISAKTRSWDEVSSSIGWFIASASPELTRLFAAYRTNAPGRQNIQPR